MDLQNDMPPRYCVGIDLGTTNCAAAYVDTLSPNPRIEQFLIPQRVDANTSEARSTLPSFVYFFQSEERGNVQNHSVWAITREVVERNSLSARSLRPRAGYAIAAWIGKQSCCRGTRIAM